jgi:signal transduction histidine kinase
MISQKLNELAEVERNYAIIKHVRMITHDLIRPFSLLTNGAKILRDLGPKEFNPEVLNNVIENVERTASKVKEMLNDILTNTGTLNLKLSTVSVDQLIRNTIDEILLMDGIKTGSIRTFFDHKAKIVCDHFKVSRVVSNIVNNAIDETNGDGDIEINTKNSLSHVFISIKNNKSFIPVEKIGRLFEPSELSTKVGRYGLGLSICRKIVEAHGGTIGVKSDQRLMTTEFFFTLPISPKNEKNSP